MCSTSSSSDDRLQELDRRVDVAGELLDPLTILAPAEESEREALALRTSGSPDDRVDPVERDVGPVEQHGAGFGLLEGTGREPLGLGADPDDTQTIGRDATDFGEVAEIGGGVGHHRRRQAQRPPVDQAKDPIERTPRRDSPRSSTIVSRSEMKNSRTTGTRRRRASGPSTSMSSCPG